MATLNTFSALAVAFVLGTAIGFERQLRQRTAGLRTNVLVAVGAAAFSDRDLRARRRLGCSGPDGRGADAGALPDPGDRDRIGKRKPGRARRAPRADDG